MHLSPWRTEAHQEVLRTGIACRIFLKYIFLPSMCFLKNAALVSNISIVFIIITFLNPQFIQLI